LVTLIACAAPGSDQTTTGALPRDLARQPQILPSGQVPDDLVSPSPAKKKKGKTKDPGDTSEDTSDQGGGSPTGPRTLAGVTDASGDAGLQAPDHADLAAVTVIDTGRRARIVVDAMAPFPNRLADGEVMGLGVDLFRGAGTESDYQVFADGSSEGWFAYLQTPQGFVSFPGSFLIGGRRMVFEVPWQALGRIRAGRVSAFLDWSKRAVPLNQVGQDRAPDSGTSPFQR